MLNENDVETVVLMSRVKDRLPKKRRISGLFEHFPVSGEERI